MTVFGQALDAMAEPGSVEPMTYLLIFYTPPTEAGTSIETYCLLTGPHRRFPDADLTDLRAYVLLQGAGYTQILSISAAILLHKSAIDWGSAMSAIVTLGLNWPAPACLP